MNKLLILLVSIIFSVTINAQTDIGAWEGFSTSKEGYKLKN